MGEGGFHAWIHFIGRCRKCPSCKLTKNDRWEFCPEHNREANQIVNIK